MSTTTTTPRRTRLSLFIRIGGSVQIGDVTVRVRDPDRGPGVKLVIEAPADVQIVRDYARQTQPRLRGVA